MLIFRTAKTIFYLISLFALSKLGFAQENRIPPSFLYYAESYPNTVYYAGSGESKTLYITFDDGPSAITTEILDILKAEEVKATFFWQGKNLVERPKTVNRALNEGHALGNHSWDHPNCINMTADELWKYQVQPTQIAYDSLFSIKVDLYRPPFGAISEGQIEHLKQKGISTILWTISTFDWDIDRNSADQMFDIFKNEIEPGAIILLHDEDFGGKGEDKIDAILRIIRFAKEEGYHFSTISEIINSK